MQGSHGAPVAVVPGAAGVGEPKASVEDRDRVLSCPSGQRGRFGPLAARVSRAGVHPAFHQGGVDAQDGDHVRGVLVVGPQVGHLNGRLAVDRADRLPDAFTGQGRSVGQGRQGRRRGIGLVACRGNDGDPAGGLTTLNRHSRPVLPAFRGADHRAQTVVAGPLGQLRGGRVRTRSRERIDDHSGDEDCGCGDKGQRDAPPTCPGRAGPPYRIGVGLGRRGQLAHWDHHGAAALWKS